VLAIKQKKTEMEKLVAGESRSDYVVTASFPSG